MAATAEPSDDLDLARRALDDLGSEVVTLSPWLSAPDPQRGDWYLELELRPDRLNPTGPIPATTRWAAVVRRSYPAGPIHIFPAATGGIAETFPHQEANDPEADGIPWRHGKLCLVDTLNGHQLAAKSDDPPGSYPTTHPSDRP